ncbi:MAG: sugar ABC transporter substrate-binding protein [Spirochaetaceae bacterium]|nr:sugar ABC transporter substrate-binding protein [Spirochaetaceae bacterium]
MNKRFWRQAAAIIVVLMVAGVASFANGSADMADDTFTLGMVSITVNDSSNARFINGATAAAEELGWETIVIDAHGSADEANAAFQNLALRGVDAIIDLVFPVSSLGAGLKAAEEAGIVVGTWGGGLGGIVAATNGTGGIQAKPIVEQMVADMGGKGSILALTYHAGQVAREREQVLDDIVSQYPDITVTRNEVRIPGYIQDGAEFASAWLAAHPKNSEPLAIWGSWDDPALGAISTMKQQDRDDVLVYGQNGNIDAIVAVKDGWMTATAWAPVEEEGRVMVETLADAIEAGDSWTPKAVEVPVVVVNAQTIDAFLEENPDADGE